MSTKQYLNLIHLFKNDWKNLIVTRLGEQYFIELSERVDFAYQNSIVFPPQNKIFEAFNLCSFKDTRVVIIGQDPYHQEGQANGLSFSVSENVKFPPSLQNISKELSHDVGQSLRSGNLDYWASQGVLMLNSVLTVEKGNPGSHQNMGWQFLTQQIISILNAQKSNVTFMLWGNYAKKLAKMIDSNKHHILLSAHPSPLSANRGGWFGTKPFSKANEQLNPPIIWV